MKNLFIFALGAATGSIATYYIVKCKFEEQADEEIASVVATFKNKTTHLNNEADDTVGKNITTLQPPVDRINNKIAEDLINDESNESEPISYNNVINNYTSDEEVVEVDVEHNSPIEIISLDEYGMIDDYDAVSYMYYDNKVLVDNYENIIQEPETIIGDALQHFGENGEVDSVYVRNNATHTDYEILKSEKDFEI